MTADTNTVSYASGQDRAMLIIYHLRALAERLAVPFQSQPGAVVAKAQSND